MQIVNQLKAMELNAWVGFALAISEFLILDCCKKEIRSFKPQVFCRRHSLIGKHSVFLKPWHRVFDSLGLMREFEAPQK